MHVIPDPSASNIQSDLDLALENSFPASDPPASTEPARADSRSQVRESAVALADVFRVVPSAGVAGVFSEEDNTGGGRWTTPGVAAIYAALTPAGAILEFLAHMDGDREAELMLVTGRLPKDAFETAQDLPPRWRETPYRADVRAFGDGWIRNAGAVGLILPSVLCEASRNVLINPAHPRARALELVRAEPFSLDPRLARGT